MNKEEKKCKKHGVVHKNGGYPSCPKEEPKIKLCNKLLSVIPQEFCTNEKPCPIHEEEPESEVVGELLGEERYVSPVKSISEMLKKEYERGKSHSDSWWYLSLVHLDSKTREQITEKRKLLQALEDGKNNIK